MFRVLVFILGVIATIFNGFVISLAWSWFFVPLGLPAITIPFAIMLSLFWKLLSFGQKDIAAAIYMSEAFSKKYEEYEDNTHISSLILIIAQFFMSALFLLLLWILTFFV